MEKIQKKVANKKRPQETMPIDESLADIPEWRKPLREWWSRTGPTPLSPSTLGLFERNSGVGFWVSKDTVGCVEGIMKSHQLEGGILDEKNLILYFYAI